MKNKIYDLSDKDFIQLIKSSINVSEVLFKLKMSSRGNSYGYSQVRQRMSKLQLTTGDFKGKSAITTRRNRMTTPTHQLLTENSKHTRGIVRRRIISENLLEYKCALCGISEWNGEELSLELDHINGVNNDNRIENLRFLCPNCHSQTSTYGAKNQKLQKPKYEITDDVRNMIIDEYTKEKSIKRVKHKLGIVEHIVTRVIQEAGLNRPNQRYVIRYDENFNEIQRFGSINEMCKYVIDNNLCKTKRIKTCRDTFLRNCNKLWLDSYWKIVDIRY